MDGPTRIGPPRARSGGHESARSHFPGWRLSPGEQPGQPTEQARLLRRRVLGLGHGHLARRPIMDIARGLGRIALARRTTLAARGAIAFGHGSTATGVLDAVGRRTFATTIAPATTTARLARGFAGGGIATVTRGRFGVVHGDGDRLLGRSDDGTVGDGLHRPALTRRPCTAAARAAALAAATA